jgi:hypothetical protein
MRTLHQNKQKLHYALLIGEQPVYALDDEGNKIIEYVDEDGNIYYQETGETELLYSEPVSFFANISMSGGESQTQEYGVDISNYDAILILNKDEIPITETSIIWHKSDIGYRDTLETNVDPYTANFKVLAIKPSLNTLKVILGAITK